MQTKNFFYFVGVLDWALIDWQSKQPDTDDSAGKQGRMTKKNERKKTYFYVCLWA